MTLAKVDFPGRVLWCGERYVDARPIPTGRVEGGRDSKAKNLDIVDTNSGEWRGWKHVLRIEVAVYHTVTVLVRQSSRKLHSNAQRGAMLHPTTTRTLAVAQVSAAEQLGHHVHAVEVLELPEEVRDFAVTCSLPVGADLTADRVGRAEAWICYLDRDAGRKSGRSAGLDGGGQNGALSTSPELVRQDEVAARQVLLFWQAVARYIRLVLGGVRCENGLGG